MNIVAELADCPLQRLSAIVIKNIIIIITHASIVCNIAGIGEFGEFGTYTIKIILKFAFLSWRYIGP